MGTFSCAPISPKKLNEGVWMLLSSVLFSCSSTSTD